MDGVFLYAFFNSSDESNRFEYLTNDTTTWVAVFSVRFHLVALFCSYKFTKIIHYLSRKSLGARF